jgi:hypothetical protein
MARRYRFFPRGKPKRVDGFGVVQEVHLLGSKSRQFAPRVKTPSKNPEKTAKNGAKSGGKWRFLESFNRHFVAVAVAGSESQIAS